jgi:hypothetical protein
LTNETKQKPSPCHFIYRVGQSPSPARFFTIQKLDDLYFSTSGSFAAFPILAQYHFFTVLIGNIVTDISEELVVPIFRVVEE